MLFAKLPGELALRRKISVKEAAELNNLSEDTFPPPLSPSDPKNLPPPPGR